MWWKFGQLAAKTYGILFITAVGGILVANVAGLVGGALFAEEYKSQDVRPWLEGGWYVGTLLAFIGAILGKIRFFSGTSLGTRLSKKAEPDSSGEESTSGSEQPREVKRTGILSATAFFGFIGGLLGSLLGCSLLVFWFSLAYSPFAPTGWTSSVKVKHERTEPAGHKQPVMTTNHPVAVYLVAVPAAIGASLGATAGGVGAAMGKVTEG